MKTLEPWEDEIWAAVEAAKQDERAGTAVLRRLLVAARASGDPRRLPAALKALLQVLERSHAKDQLDVRDLCLELVRVQPENPRNFLRLGRAFEGLSDVGAARSAYEAGLAVSSDDAATRSQLQRRLDRLLSTKPH